MSTFSGSTSFPFVLVLRHLSFIRILVSILACSLFQSFVLCIFHYLGLDLRASCGNPIRRRRTGVWHTFLQIVPQFPKSTGQHGTVYKASPLVLATFSGLSSSSISINRFLLLHLSALASSSLAHN